MGNNPLRFNIEYINEVNVDTIDTEGFEYYILKEMKKLLKNINQLFK